MPVVMGIGSNTIYDQMDTRMNIYVGNLSYNSNEESMKQAFEAYGQVDTARVITDRETGRSKGFGFVEMSDSSEAREAIEALNGSDMDGRNIKVNEARPRNDDGGNRRFGNRY
jgi:RNA recognition motif-containing protein